HQIHAESPHLHDDLGRERSFARDGQPRPFGLVRGIWKPGRYPRAWLKKHADPVFGQLGHIGRDERDALLARKCLFDDTNLHLIYQRLGASEWDGPPLGKTPVTRSHATTFMIDAPSYSPSWAKRTARMNSKCSLKRITSACSGSSA